MSVNNVKVLKMTRELLSRPGVWIKGVGAQDKNGGRVRSDSPNATCFCVQGALFHTVMNVGGEQTDFRKAVEILHDASSELHQKPLAFQFNDAPETELQDILNLVDRAIEKASK